MTREDFDHLFETYPNHKVEVEVPNAIALACFYNPEHQKTTIDTIIKSLNKIEHFN